MPIEPVTLSNPLPPITFTGGGALRCSVGFRTTFTLLKGVLEALSIIIGLFYFSLSVLSVLLHFIWSSFVIQVNTNVGFDNGIPSLCNVPLYPLWLTQFWSLLSDINVATPDFFCLILCISFRADLLGTDSPFITFLKILFYFLGPPVFLTKICGHSNSCLLLFFSISIMMCAALIFFEFFLFGIYWAPWISKFMSLVKSGKFSAITKTVFFSTNLFFLSLYECQWCKT